MSSAGYQDDVVRRHQLLQAKRVALEQVQTKPAHYVAADSYHGNLILPVVPRFPANHVAAPSSVASAGLLVPTSPLQMPPVAMDDPLSSRGGGVDEYNAQSYHSQPSASAHSSSPWDESESDIL